MKTTLRWNVDTRGLVSVTLLFLLLLLRISWVAETNDYITISHHSTIQHNIYFRIISFKFSCLLLHDYGSKKIKFQVLMRCKVYIHTFIKTLIWWDGLIKFQKWKKYILYRNICIANKNSFRIYSQLCLKCAINGLI